MAEAGENSFPAAVERDKALYGPYLGCLNRLNPPIAFQKRAEVGYPDTEPKDLRQLRKETLRFKTNPFVGLESFFMCISEGSGALAARRFLQSRLMASEKALKQPSVTDAGFAGPARILKI